MFGATPSHCATGDAPGLFLYNRDMGAPDRILKKTVAAVCVLCLAACSLVAPKFNRPNVSVVSIDMRGGNLLQQNFAVKLNVQNPNDRALPVSGLSVELNVDGERIASGVSDRAFVVPAFGESEFDMTIKANMALALLKLANKLDQQTDSID